MVCLCLGALSTRLGPSRRFRSFRRRVSTEFLRERARGSESVKKREKKSSCENEKRFEHGRRLLGFFYRPQSQDAAVVVFVQRDELGDERVATLVVETARAHGASVLVRGLEEMRLLTVAPDEPPTKSRTEPTRSPRPMEVLMCLSFLKLVSKVSFPHSVHTVSDSVESVSEMPRTATRTFERSIALVSTRVSTILNFNTELTNRFVALGGGAVATRSHFSTSSWCR